MTKQAINFINLTKGNDPETILRALGMLQKSVLNELMYELEAKDQYDLAIKLSIGAY